MLKFKQDLRERELAKKCHLPLILWLLKCQFCLCRGDPEAVEIVFSDIQRLDPLEFLNDTVIDFYIKYVWPTSFQLSSEYLFLVYTSAICFLVFVTRYLHVDAPMYYHVFVIMLLK